MMLTTLLVRFVAFAAFGSVFGAILLCVLNHKLSEREKRCHIKRHRGFDPDSVKYLARSMDIVDSNGEHTLGRTMGKRAAMKQFMKHYPMARASH